MAVGEPTEALVGHRALTELSARHFPSSQTSDDTALSVLCHLVSSHFLMTELQLSSWLLRFFLDS